MTDKNDGRLTCPDYAALSDAIKRADDAGEVWNRDLLRALEVTSEELEAIGYDRENFPELHEMLK